MKKESLLKNVSTVIFSVLILALMVCGTLWINDRFTETEYGIWQPTPLFKNNLIKLPNGEYSLIDEVFEETDADEPEYTYQVDGKMYRRNELVGVSWDIFVDRFNEINEDIDAIKKKLKMEKKYF